MATIYLRGEMYYSRLFVNGKQIRKPLSRDKRIAENMLAQMMVDGDILRRGGSAGGEDMSWDGFKQRYLQHSKATKNIKTYEAEEWSLRLLGEMFPIKKLSQVTPELLDQLKERLKIEGYGIPSINKHLQVIKTAMSTAEKWNFILPQKWEKVTYFKQARGRLLFYSIDELKKLLEKSYDFWKIFVMLGARAGLRRSEVYYLKWEDVDFERNRIHICPKGDWHPKNYEQRWIPMPPDLATFLRALPYRGEWVLKERWSIGSISGNYSRYIIKPYGFKGSLHTLRHTYASHLAQAGVPLYDISKLLGHSSIKMTQVYAHLCPESYNKAVERLPALSA